MGERPFSEEDKIYLILAYLGLLALIPFLMFKDKRGEPQKEFVFWHGREGMGLLVVSILSTITCVGPLVCLVVAIMAILKALEGQRWEIPLVHAIAEKFG